MILKFVGRDDSIVTYEKDEPFTTRIKTPDSSKAKKDLDFQLTISLDEGMKKTVDWFKDFYRR